MNRTRLAARLVEAARIILSAPTRLSPHLKINEIRQQKNELFGSLSDLEVEILDAVAGTGSCFGDDPKKKGGNGKIVLTRPRSAAKVIEDGQRVVNQLVRSGWLRFAPSPAVGFGLFWQTDVAEAVWRELGRRPRHR